jgi:hypothetical protein
MLGSMSSRTPDAITKQIADLHREIFAKKIELHADVEALIVRGRWLCAAVATRRLTEARRATPTCKPSDPRL